jgi:hypothetical protein
MRRSSRIALCAAVALGLLGPTMASAEELPVGFTDGLPVGEEPGSEAGAVGTAAVTTRYFGAGPFQAVRDAVDATPRSCTIGPLTLTALVLAPVFKESSAATTASTAPSPMTLSRYDEWSGIYPTTTATDTNRNANYGLYAFRNPSTPYQRAYWHPGIGIWQYDSAGVGAPFTAVERMDVGTVAADVARVMAERYCNPSSTLIGHPAPFSAQERRYSAWADWGYPCTLCQGFFDEMIGTSPAFANLALVPGISELGGTVERTCALVGVPGTMPCWYVEPVVGTIEGATTWATLDPTGGSSATVAPAPLSRPFYVLDRGAAEERHWLRVDTGYGTDISATRTIGKNARPRLNQAGSGLTWSSTSGLCDLTTGRGVCGPIPPAGVSAAPIKIIGTSYRVMSLDADGDGLDDVLFYGPGSTSDAIWLTDAPGAFSAGPAISVNGAYDDVLVGDLDGDGDDDIIWYKRSSGSSFLWRSDGDGTFSSSALTPGAGRRPFLLDRDGDGADEVFWYGPGSVPDSVWHWTASGFAASAIRVSGTYRPLVGDFDGNQRDDIIWYAPGGASDGMWLHKQAGGYVIVNLTVNGSYLPTVANVDGDQSDDVFWYAPGSAGDYVWYGAPGGSFSVQPMAVNGTYTTVVADLLGTGRDGILFYAPGPAGDYWWTWSTGRTMTSQPVTLPSTQQAVVGAYSAGGGDGIVWYGPGSVVDTVWFR